MIRAPKSYSEGGKKRSLPAKFFALTLGRSGGEEAGKSGKIFLREQVHVSKKPPLTFRMASARKSTDSNSREKNRRGDESRQLLKGLFPLGSNSSR